MILLTVKGIFMYNYSFISLTAFLCYLIMFVVFTAAEKDKVIRSFFPALLVSMLWSGGSFAMRMDLWPGPEFWFFLSLSGLFFIPYYSFCFICSILERREMKLKRLFFAIAVVNYAVNAATGLYIPRPELVRTEGGLSCFVYHTGWPCVLLLVMLCLPIFCIVCFLRERSKEENLRKGQLRPVFFGLFILVLGHLARLLPGLSCYPSDMISGIVNAVCLFYVLYRKRLFQLNFQVSRGVVFGICTLLAAALSANYIDPILYAIRIYLPGLESRSILIVAVFFAFLTFFLAAAVKAVIDKAFINRENIRSENLKKFSRSVSKSLKIEDIGREISTVLRETLDFNDIFICVENSTGTGYEPALSDAGNQDPLFPLSNQDPAVTWLKENKCCYTEKGGKKAFEIMERLDMLCMVPMVEDEILAGIIFLSYDKRDRHYGRNEINFLESIGSIASIAVRNSRLYEQAYREARQDDLTGLLNRKYFYHILHEICDQNPGRRLCVIIFNLDDFKLFNQLYGIHEGDAALKKIAGIIQKNVGDKGYVARYSGKEFATALPDCTTEEAEQIAKTIRKGILEINSKGRDALMKTLTVSCGICGVPESANNIKQLMENADMAVYTVKQKGKNGVMVYNAAHSQTGKCLKTNREVYSSYRSTIYALTAAIDTKDHYTFSHSNHVAEYAGELAREYGMNEDFLELVKEAGLLHDIGKIGIPEQILNKTDRLEPDEYEIMKGHVEASIRIIRNLPSLDYVIPAVIGHHERYDGKGYPREIKGEDIPLSARILCIADSFDAMISKRSYKDERSVDYALEEILRNAGKQFDPQLAPLFVEAVKAGRISPLKV